ncbi:hypothetical protein GCM10022251_11350 [Phytohabitans flavus]|uniref:Condensation domain-containing protein n=1 Tax=Phytohabitans flavus TaxID=1076124 RepID=A0A6F8XJS0_9ACTN|nr:condensation domain-containing protein [Phytohabitans flavus]BCB74060.1 hypothetical protein Pflav_004700 [Phytohabitans flavus]
MTSTSVSTGIPVGTSPLSLQQEFLHMIDHGDEAGPFGPRYTIVGGWRLTGELDLGALQGALDDVVVRHETLRTSIVRSGDTPYQMVLPPAPVRLEVRRLEAASPADRDRVAEEFLNDLEAGKFAIEEVPILRAFLGRFDERDAVLVLGGHHTAIDGWSVHCLMRDIAAYYAARRERRAPDLPEIRQYREYVAWQRANVDSPAVVAARAYWRENLAGAQVVPIPTDKPRTEETFFTAWHRFLFDDGLRSGTAAWAARTASSPFMVLLGAYLMYLREQTGESELVVPTFTPGRQLAWIQDTVGSFYNFLPLRTDITGCATLPEVVRRVRATCLAAYQHEIPFASLLQEAPTVMDAAVSGNFAACVFQVTQSPDMMYGGQAGGLRIAAMRRRVLSAPVGSQIPDGVLFGLEVDPAGGIIGSVGYTTNLFVESGIVRMISDFERVLHDTVGQPVSA